MPAVNSSPEAHFAVLFFFCYPDRPKDREIGCRTLTSLGDVSVLSRVLEKFYFDDSDHREGYSCKTTGSQRFAPFFCGHPPHFARLRKCKSFSFYFKRASCNDTHTHPPTDGIRPETRAGGGQWVFLSAGGLWRGGRIKSHGTAEHYCEWVDTEWSGGGCERQATGGLRGTREGLMLFLGFWSDSGYRFLKAPGIFNKSNMRPCSYMGELRRFVRGLNFRLLGGQTMAA